MDIIFLKVAGIIVVALLCIIFLQKLVKWEKIKERFDDFWEKCKNITSNTFFPSFPIIPWRKILRWVVGLLSLWIVVQVVWPFLRKLSSVHLKAPLFNWDMPPFLRMLWTFVASNPLVTIGITLFLLSLGIRLVYWKWEGNPSLVWQKRSYWILFFSLLFLLFSFGVVRMDAAERAWYEGKLAAPQSDDNRLQLLVVQDSLQRALLAERRRGDSLFQLPRTVIMGPPQESTEHFVPPRIQKTNVPLVQKKKGKMPSLFRCHKKNTTKRSPRVVVQDNRYQF